LHVSQLDFHSSTNSQVSLRPAARSLYRDNSWQCWQLDHL
jgi:hypothetical protein